MNKDYYYVILVREVHCLRALHTLLDTWKISLTSPPSPPATNMSTNNNRNSGDTTSDRGDITSTTSKIPPPKEPENDAHLKKSGDIGDGGDIIRLSLGSYGNCSTDLIQLDDKDYVAFDLEWDNDHTGNNRTIYTAAFVDNRGNQKVLHISDYGNSEPALIRAIREEILKYPASIGWYTTGIARR